MTVRITKEQLKSLIDAVYPKGKGTYNPTPFDYAIADEAQKVLMRYLAAEVVYVDKNRNILACVPNASRKWRAILRELNMHEGSGRYDAKIALSGGGDGSI